MSQKTPSTMTPARAQELAADFLARRRAWAGGLELTMTGPVPGPPAPGPAPQPAPQPAPAPAPQPAPAQHQRPDGIAEAEWAALGDPGKAAIVRERAARQTAEQALAAERAARPRPQPAPPAPGSPPAPPAPQDPNDIAGMIQRAVSAAIAPMHEAQAQRDADTAAASIRDAVVTAAAVRMHDAADALTQIDLTGVTDGTGRPDPTKITAALDALLTAKPYLGRVVDTRLQAPPGSLVGSTGAFMPSLDDRTKATLARMQASAGVKFADQTQA